MIGLLIEQVSAVAGHAHVLQGDAQAQLIGLVEEAEFSPFLHYPADGLAVLLVIGHLLLGHGHEKPLFQTRGQVLEHFILSAADRMGSRVCDILDRFL